MMANITGAPLSLLDATVTLLAYRRYLYIANPLWEYDNFSFVAVGQSRLVCPPWQQVLKPETLCH